MALSSALFSSVSALAANQTLLDVVGNNLANANTTGYKSQRVEFQDLVYQTLSAGSALGKGVGGTNPQQVGFGVRVGSLATNISAGSLQQTGRDLDLAIQGDGLFAVNDGVQNLYTR